MGFEGNASIFPSTQQPFTDCIHSRGMDARAGNHHTKTMLRSSKLIPLSRRTAWTVFLAVTGWIRALKRCPSHPPNTAMGANSARGIHGQAIYIDPTAEMVIARFGSHPLAANTNFDPTSLPAYHAVAQFLLKQG